MSTQTNPNLLPPAVADLLTIVRDTTADSNYRENVAARLSIIVQACQGELARFRDERDKAEAARRRRRR